MASGDSRRCESSDELRDCSYDNEKLSRVFFRSVDCDAHLFRCFSFARMKQTGLHSKSDFLVQADESGRRAVHLLLHIGMQRLSQGVLNGVHHLQSFEQ